MKRYCLALALAAGCATTTTVPGPKVASSGPMSFTASASDCAPVKRKRTGLVAAAITTLGISAGTGIATAAEIGKPDTHDLKLGLGVTAAVTGAAALATGISALVVNQRMGSCR